MKRFILILVVVAFLTPVAAVHAEEPVPFEEFISITEKALDALDEIETVCSNYDSMKIEARMAVKKYDIAVKKYDRYVKTWPKGKQANIAWAMTSARLSYDMAFNSSNMDEMLANEKKAIIELQKARELYVKYKSKKNR